MSDNELKFLKVLHDSNWPDSTRLIYADWLDEHDDPDHAFAIRYHVLWCWLVTPQPWPLHDDPDAYTLVIHPAPLSGDVADYGRISETIIAAADAGTPDVPDAPPAVASR